MAADFWVLLFGNSRELGILPIVSAEATGAEAEADKPGRDLHMPRNSACSVDHSLSWYGEMGRSMGVVDHCVNAKLQGVEQRRLR